MECACLWSTPVYPSLLVHPNLNLVRPIVDRPPRLNNTGLDRVSIAEAVKFLEIDDVSHQRQTK